MEKNLINQEEFWNLVEVEINNLLNNPQKHYLLEKAKNEGWFGYTHCNRDTKGLLGYFRMNFAKQIKILKRIDNPTPLPKDIDYFKSDWFANAVLQNGYVSLNLFKQEHLDDIKKFETGYKN